MTPEEHEHLRAATDTLEGVLCGPSGEVVITGTDGDRAQASHAMEILRGLCLRGVTE